MSLTADERAIALDLVRHYGYDACPRCGDELTAHDDGVTPALDKMPAGAYVSCDTCGWEFRMMSNGIGRTSDYRHVGSRT